MPEEELGRTKASTLLPYFEKLPSGELVNSQGLVLRYRYSSPPEAKKALVILPGRTEPAMKYAELIRDLEAQGIRAFVLDHQGQGSSQRSLSDPDKGHVADFADYVRDVKLWMDTVVLPATGGQELYLLGHSMGGLIGTYYVRDNPKVFRKMVLSTPLFELAAEPVGETVARGIFWILKTLGKGEDYILGRGPYVPQEDTYSENFVTHSRARFDMNKLIYTKRRETALGGPTVNWGLEIIDRSREVLSFAEQIKLPVLLLQAGLDRYVKPERQNEFCKLARDCRISTYPEAYHEILNETDRIRSRALAELLAFLR